MKKDLLSIYDLTAEEIEQIFQKARELKEMPVTSSFPIVLPSRRPVL